MLECLWSFAIGCYFFFVFRHVGSTLSSKKPVNTIPDWWCCFCNIFSSPPIFVLLHQLDYDVKRCAVQGSSWHKIKGAKSQNSEITDILRKIKCLVIGKITWWASLQPASLRNQVQDNLEGGDHAKVKKPHSRHACVYLHYSYQLFFIF